MSEERTVLVTGATGLVGGRLVPALVREGFRVRALTRSPAGAADRLPSSAARFAWDGLRPSLEALRGADAIVHLAGEPIFSGPLTRSRRERIRASRVDSTRFLVEALGRLGRHERPRTLICASAVGVYGSRGEQLLEESAPPGTGFLPDVCVAWEAAARAATAQGVRPVSLRIGIVLAREGGALAAMARAFRLGVGGRLGNGRQWVPWIHAQDLVGLVLFSLASDTLEGPVNAVSPNPVRNHELTRALARAVGRPALLPAPSWLLRAVLRELAEELLGSRRVVPRVAEEHGFEFSKPGLEATLAAELN